MTTTMKVTIEDIMDFADVLNENNLSNQILGTEDDCVLIEVHYSRADREAIDELEELAADE
ncbi:MAG: hypothetical protein FJY07_13130 [Bacteroidetes bacterium]|nr:hypothetical protein [Bacteroidota bacterium]